MPPLDLQAIRRLSGGKFAPIQNRVNGLLNSTMRSRQANVRSRNDPRLQSSNPGGAFECWAISLRVGAEVGHTSCTPTRERSRTGDCDLREGLFLRYVPILFT